MDLRNKGMVSFQVEKDMKTVNMIVHEVFGTIASEEGIVQKMRSLRPRLDLTQAVVFVTVLRPGPF